MTDSPAGLGGVGGSSDRILQEAMQKVSLILKVYIDLEM